MAFITCSVCKGKTDLLAEPQRGQDQSSFICEECQDEHNKRELRARFELRAPTVELRPVREKQTITSEDVGNLSAVLRSSSKGK